MNSVPLKALKALCDIGAASPQRIVLGLEDHGGEVAQAFEGDVELEVLALHVADDDFNLNIPRYVDTFEEESEIDLDAVKQEIATLESQLATVRSKMANHLKDLGL